MARKKDEGPRPYEIAIAGVLSVIVGVLGSAVFLAFQEPEEVSELPDEDEERRMAQVYYLAGASPSAEHGTWEAKQQAIEARRSGTFELVEQELNHWATSVYGDDAETEVGPVQITAGTPEFRIQDTLQIKVDLEYSVFGFDREFTSLSWGNFEQRRGEYVYRPSRVYIGSCPIPNVFGLAQGAVNRITAAYEVSPELREAWAELASVEIEDEELKIAIP